ncbi:hypothetical protein GG804_27205 [Sphingomonas histidinilytica]|uniref:phage tail length tape measure family protein n=1 Tax=Rhizorhabdus histidinilytica TaxID=439228 RepID=UPI0004AA9D9E|nr:phage tail length tape measure family protein [Rhizorhabdus histidinilytica]ARR53490.1 hypothetical protein HY78_08675 [Rhizorhabdus wittichii DC-6]MBO9380456.1 hypothetical protein [Rhizorhabdus histidinilytica]
MSVTADSVVVDLIANTGSHDANVNKSAANFENASKRAVKAANDVERSTARMANAQRNLGRQIADVGAQLASGQSPFMIIAQQAPQVADALADTGGAAGRVAAFFAGPWGAALLAGASVLGVLAGKLLETGDAAATAEKKLRSFATSADLAARSDEVAKSVQKLGELQAQYERLGGPSRQAQNFFAGTEQAKRMRAQIAELQADIESDRRLIDLRSSKIDTLDQQKAAADQAKKDAVDARKAEREAKQAQAELEATTKKLQNAFDPLGASAREYYDVLKDIADLERRGIITSSTAQLYRDGAEIARRAAAFKAEGIDRPSINDILNRPGGISSQVAADDKRIADDWEREQALRKAQADTEAYLQREREQNVRSLASLYRSAFEGGAKGIGQALKEALLDAIATALARQTIGAFAGLIGGGGVGGFIGKAIFGRASGGYAAPRSLHRVNETAGGVELLRMGPTGGQVIPLGQSQASPRGGGTTVLQTIAVDARGAVMNREFAAMILAQAEQRAVQLDAVSGKAVYNATPQRLQQQNLLGS